MLNRERYLKYIEDCLALLSFKIKDQNSICLFDLNRISEDVYCEILGAVFGWKLTNANVRKKNAKAIDLVDDEAKVVVQVSSEKGIRKVRESLAKMDVQKYHGYAFKFLSLVADPPTNWTDSEFVGHVPKGIKFRCNEDVFGPNRLLRRCNSLGTSDLSKVYKACLENFDNTGKGPCSITLDVVKMFFAIMSETMKFECRVKDLCSRWLDMSDEPNNKVLRDELLDKIKFLSLNQLCTCFINVDSSMGDFRLNLAADHELLESVRLISRLHDIIDAAIVEDLSIKDIKTIQRAIEYEMKLVARILKMFAQRLHINEVDLNAEFSELIKG